MKEKSAKRILRILRKLNKKRDTVCYSAVKVLD